MADRENQRIQIFDADGKLLKQWDGSAYGLFLTPDGRIWMADGGYGRIIELDPGGKIIGALGQPGHEPGEFAWAHFLAFDSDGENVRRGCPELARSGVRAHERKARHLQLRSDGAKVLGLQASQRLGESPIGRAASRKVDRSITDAPSEFDVASRLSTAHATVTLRLSRLASRRLDSGLLERALNEVE